MNPVFGLSHFCVFGCFGRGIPIGPCTAHPYVLLIPRDSGVNPLHLYTTRGHSHPQGLWAALWFLPSLELEGVLPIHLNEKKS